MKTFASVLALFISVHSFGQSPYSKKYAGTYSIGQDTGESYTLKEDGTCTWIYGWTREGKLKTQKKYGTWTAKEQYIRISVKGNTGIIVEEYVLKNGRFINNEDPNRYLTKNN